VEVLRHCVLFRFTEPPSTDELAEIEACLVGLAATIPEIRGYWYGADAGLVDGNWDYAVVADFDDASGYRAYAEHPAHTEALRQVFRPLLADRAAVQFEW
jgi:hypothetical protein